MEQKEIRMHKITAEGSYVKRFSCISCAHAFQFLYMILEIVAGKEKAIMRIILALAAHFKPNSVKQTKTARSMAGIAQVMLYLPLTFKL